MHQISWPVIHWKKIWRTLWFPTINVKTSDTHLSEGTWHVHVLVDGKIYAGLWPYFPDREMFEIHLLGFNEMIYDTQVTIFPLKKIRDNKQFWSVDELTKQIAKDKAHVENTSITWITFWTFDVFHAWHIAYLRQAKQRCDKLITVVALDETVHTIKWHYPTDNATTRMHHIEKANISNTVILWNDTNYYSCLEEWQPDIICLWYDQSSFDKNLQEFYTWQWQDLPTIVRLDAYKPEIYKSSLLKI